MKKYIAPVAKSLFLEAEACLLTGSNPQLQNDLSDYQSQLSNERSISDGIWGSDED